jgi:hypothetical protein
LKYVIFAKDLLDTEILWYFLHSNDDTWAYLYVQLSSACHLRFDGFLPGLFSDPEDG